MKRLLVYSVLLFLVACSNENAITEKHINHEANGDSLNEDYKQDDIDGSPIVQENWTIYVEGDVVVTNQLKCNDTTGKEIPSHLIQICDYYEKLEPLSKEQKEILSQGTGGLAARDAFNRDIPIGRDGFAEGLEDYGEYLLFSYLFWRTGYKPNAHGDFKSINQTSNFDEFFQLDVETVETYYEPVDQNNDIYLKTLLEAIEYEIKVLSRMKHLNLEEPFNIWINETVEIFIKAKQLYNEENFKESYLEYYKGLKRIHDLYFTIPEHNHLTG